MTRADLVGWCHARLGQYQQALKLCRRALVVQERLGDRHGEAGTRDSLGFAYFGLGEYAEAADEFGRALDLYRDLGDRYNEADTLVQIGDNHHHAGDLDAAQRTWREALDLLEQLHHPDAVNVRTRLNQVEPHRAAADDTTRPTVI